MSHASFRPGPRQLVYLFIYLLIYLFIYLGVSNLHLPFRDNSLESELRGH